MNTQDIKHRISSVGDTVKITQAMQMISASKMHKTQMKCETSRRYLSELESALSRVPRAALEAHAYVRQNEGKKIGLIVVAGDKGLCGDYNHRVLSFADSEIARLNATQIFAVGQEARDYFRRKQVPLNSFYAHMAQEPHAFDAIAVTNDMLDLYRTGEYGAIYLIYTRVDTLSSQRPTIKRLLPIELPEAGDELPFEPKNEEAVTNFLAQYVMAQIYSALADSTLAINYKRMVSMQESTKNGNKLIEELVSEYNHKRQEGITNELMNSSASSSRGGNL